VNSLAVTEVASAPLSGAYANVVPFSIKDQIYLLGYNPSKDHLDVYRFKPNPPGIQAVSAQPKVGSGQEMLEPLVVGNRPHLLCYTAAKGLMNLFALGDDLSITKPYTFYRNHDPGISQGFTTVKPFTSFGQVAILGYNGTTGPVATYLLGVLATLPPDVPPLLLTPVWSHQWAKGWTRFAFFQLGGENFFLKTNTWKPNVNIDHVLDGLAGTVEVGTNLDLTDAQELDVVQPFTLDHGDPYFVTYKNDGTVAFYRFHSDCQGWTPVGLLTGPAGATHVVPLQTADGVFLLIT
jgi:hypothetical protein